MFSMIFRNIAMKTNLVLLRFKLNFTALALEEFFLADAGALKIIKSNRL
jgi:hypothetical protein